MRVKTIAAILMLAVIAVMALGDILNSGLQTVVSSQIALIVLLACIPISLALFFFLSYYQSQRAEVEKPEE